MHRPTLTLRRFGPMSFGLGYFENGIWVDHSIPDGSTSPDSTSPGSSDENASPSDGVALDAVHRWYGCCVDSIAAHPSVIATLANSERPRASVVAVMPLPVRAVEK